MISGAGFGIDASQPIFHDMNTLDRVTTCTLCAEKFASTATAHRPRPVVWVSPEPQLGARILIAGQAPGARVHASGKPFGDPSGERLRAWMGVDTATFYDKSQIAIAPMAFCFPGYDARGADLPPPRICAETWRNDVLAHVGPVRLTLLIGAHAQNWHLGRGPTLTQRVQAWRDHAPKIFVLPHPSWRNTGWINRNPWFTTETLPALRGAVKDALT